MSMNNPRQVVPGSDPSHAFAKVAQADIQRSAFDLSRPRKMTFDTDYLYPFFREEVLPGDTFSVTPTMVVQMLTLKQQLMDSLYMDVHFWFVPNRLVWTNWQKFQGERANPDDSIDYTTPQFPAANTTDWGENTLADYLGYPTKVAGLSAVAFYNRAYNLIYNTWYRDQNLIDSAVVDVDDGPDSPADYPLRKRGKRKDYLTSALPWPQKGEAVSLPLGTTAPVVFPTGVHVNTVVDNTAATAQLGLSSGVLVGAGLADGAAGINTFTGKPDDVYADLSSATAATINALRQAFTIQQLLERDARGGTRYTEIIHSHFGVVSPDARLQRPEFLGGGSVPVIIHSVVNTNQATGSTLGNRAAFGHAQSTGGLGFTQSFTEHGVILGILSVRQEYTYQQGLDRALSRSTRNDYYMPVFANLGEQAVLRREVKAQGTGADTEVFGYQERWGEYRSSLGSVAGKFRSNATGTLDSWHLAQVFSGTPTLNQDFIEENVPTDRVVMVTTEPVFSGDFFVSVRATRPLPIFSTPGLRVL